MKIIGLDLSLTSTGVAVVDDHVEVGRRVTVQRIRSNGKKDATIADRTDRLRRLAAKILIPARDADLVVIEGPAYHQSNPGMHDRSGLWWLVTERLHAYDWPVAEVSPSVVKKYATGKGNAGKDQVLAAVVRRYPDVEVGGNDEADALILAALGARFLGQPIDDMPALQSAVVASVRWPAHLTEEAPF
ncbi:crossover junction endodeoxyribonuclease RuvC [Nocardioides lijunqiniae]|uniref:crossover junction endodeoxyribonuclease RuvC n=1 Tax=Nocardioides lijunqiniae TaxID=2760832 RepID=UPI001878844B